MARDETEICLEQVMAAGAGALQVGDWDTALRNYCRAVELAGTAEALEGLAMAAWWADQAETMFDARQHAYRLFRDRQDDAGATRMAIWLGLDHYIFRYAPAIANGWIRRAERLLESRDELTFEHAFLAFSQAHIALENHQIARTLEHARRGRNYASQVGVFDLEVTCMALEGLALVSQGVVSEGMDLLDESVTAAMSGDVHDPDAIVTSCCYFFYACERVRDFNRAAQWCDTITELCRQWSYRSMVSVCRAHYASVLTWTGDWERADRELLQARVELLNGRVGWAPEATLRLAELRRRQGKLDEAEALLQQSAENPLAFICRAQIALERADTETASNLIERFFRRIPATELTQHFSGLEVAVRVYTQAGNYERAGEALRGMEEMAHAAATIPLQAAASFSRAHLLRARGKLDEARREFEDAIDLYVSTGAQHEAARARLELATLLNDAGRRDLALVECSEAAKVFQRLGALGDQRRANQLLIALQSERDLTAASDTSLELAHLVELTAREREIMSLIAAGYANPEIAERLYISVRTVERHVSTIYSKLGAHGAAARAFAVSLALGNDGNGPTSDND